MVIRQSQLKETAEKGIYMVRGESFQVNSMRSDFYVKKEKGEWVPINDSRYPVETMVNLLQNRITDNQHQLKLRHHQYGGKIPTIVLPMQNLFDLFARHMDLYCSVTYIDENDPPFLIFHGTNDVLVSIYESQILYQGLKEAGVPARFVVVEDGTHGGLHFYQPGVMDMVVEFFQENLAD